MRAGIGAWETAWDSINEAFGQLAVEVRECNTKLWWECGHTDNEAFPFSAYASFGRLGHAGEEDVVISLSFKLSDGELIFSSDVARGDGEILVDGPTGQLLLAADVTSVRAWIADRVLDGLEFISDVRDLLKRELCWSRCAEPRCLRQALDAGIDPSGGTMTAVQVGDVGLVLHGAVRPPCPSCQVLRDVFGYIQ